MKITATPAAEARLRHAAGFHSCAADLLGQLVPLVESGVAQGRTVALSVGAETEQALREAVTSPDALHVIAAPEGAERISGQTVALHRARHIRSLIDRVGPVTLLTEHAAELDGADGAFWTELDAAVNVAMVGLAVRQTCFFPEMALHQSVLDGARLNHRYLLVEGELRDNPAYRRPQEVLAHHPASAPMLLGAPDLQIVFRAWQLHDVRRAIGDIAGAVGFSVDRTDDVVLAVNEVATNAVEHGSREAELTVWAEADALVCEVHDVGSLRDPLPGLRAPHPSGPRGRGLWIARQLCDLLHVWADARGTHVRVRAAA